MRIVLLYPPPWKIPAPGEDPERSGEGPPSNWHASYAFDGDTLHIPCGLLSLAAQARHAGHEVTVLNLSTHLPFQGTGQRRQGGVSQPGE